MKNYWERERKRKTLVKNLYRKSSFMEFLSYPCIARVSACMLEMVPKSERNNCSKLIYFTVKGYDIWVNNGRV